MYRTTGKAFIKPSGRELWSKILRPEKNFYFVSFTYACGISLLSLAIPISVQALVNTLTFAVLKQPLIIVSLLLLSLLIFSGILRGLQDLAIEYFQRHFYARNVSEFSRKVINAKDSSLSSLYIDDLVNRYFDIMTIQKSGSKLLIEGFTLVLKVITGMLLLAFYHPYFLIFDLVLIFLLIIIWFIYGKQSLDTAILESKAKYKAAAWLEQLALHNNLFDYEKGKVAAFKKTEENIKSYLVNRSNHFNFLFKQIVFLLVIYAFMSAIILGLGGFLVIEGQLTLGQLVAAEIVVAIILSGLTKVGGYLESFYDIHAALDKIADFDVLEEEDNSSSVEVNLGKQDIHFEAVKVDYNNVIYSFNAKFLVGKSYLLKGGTDSTQRAFLKAIYRHLDTKNGQIYYGTTNIADTSPALFRNRIFIIEDPQVIQGTFKENLTWSLDDFKESEVNEVIHAIGLENKLRNLKDGKDTLLYPGCQTFTWGDLTRLEFGRAILQKPDWLIVSSIFHQLTPNFQEEMIRLFKKNGIGLIIWSSGQYDMSLLFDEALNFSHEGSQSL